MPPNNVYAETYLDSVERTNYIDPQWLLKNLQADFQTNGLKILDLGCDKLPPDCESGARMVFSSGVSKVVNGTAVGES